MKTVLFAKDAKNNIRTWAIEEIQGDSLLIKYGPLNGSKQLKIEQINEGLASRTVAQQLRLRFNSRVSKKIDQGYVDSLSTAMSNKRSNSLGLLRPMLAQPIKNVRNIDYTNAFYQHKYDGNRCLVTKKDGMLLAYTRNGKEIKSINHILNVMDLKDGQTIDGELYCHNVSLQTINSWIKKEQSDTSKLSLRVYDIIEDKPYKDRLETLQNTSLGFNAVRVPTLVVSKESELENLLKQSIDAGYEGGILRWGDEGYEDGKRSKHLAKLKLFKSMELEVIDVVESKDGWGRLVLSTGNGKITVSAPGSVEYKYQIMASPEKYIGRILTIKYSGLTDDKKPFHPTAVAFRDDLD